MMAVKLRIHADDEARVAPEHPRNRDKLPVVDQCPAVTVRSNFSEDGIVETDGLQRASGGGRRNQNRAVGKVGIERLDTREWLGPERLELMRLATLLHVNNRPTG